MSSKSNLHLPMFFFHTELNLTLYTNHHQGSAGKRSVYDASYFSINFT